MPEGRKDLGKENPQAGGVNQLAVCCGKDLPERRDSMYKHMKTTHALLGLRRIREEVGKDQMAISMPHFISQVKRGQTLIKGKTISI